MDARAYMVAVLFGFVGGLLAPKAGSDRRAVQGVLVVVTAIGIAAWLIAPDPFAGPSLTVGSVAALVGTLVRPAVSSR
jgi:hypothetical protein